MCLYPVRIRNPGYSSLKDCMARSPYLSYSSIVPFDYMLDVPCGKCFQCLRSRRMDIVTRLKVEQAVIPKGTRSYFVTLTFSDRFLDRFKDDYLIPLRRWLDLLRKRYGRFRYWFISELGEGNSRFHFHGIIFGMKDVLYSVLCSSWRYGISWFGWVTSRTCGYITKYMTKQQFTDKYLYRPVSCFSKSIGMGLNGRGLDFVRRNTHLSPNSDCRYSVPNCLTFPGDIRFSYVLSRFYMRRLYPLDILMTLRYNLYLSGGRYVYRSHRYSDRDSWLRAIRVSRYDYSSDCRSKCSKDFVFSRKVPVRSDSRFRSNMSNSNFL